MKFKLTLFLCVALAIVSGAFLGELAAKSINSYISWLGYALNFGFDTKNFDLHVVQFNFGLHMNINVLQLMLTLLAVVVAPKLAASIKTKE